MGARPQLKPWGNYCWKTCTLNKHRLRLTESTATVCQRKTKVSLPKQRSSIYIAMPDKHDFDSQLLCADWHNLACSGIIATVTIADLKKSVCMSWQWVQVSSHTLSYHFVFTGGFCRAQPQPSLPSVTVCKGGSTSLSWPVSRNKTAGERMKPAGFGRAVTWYVTQGLP